MDSSNELATRLSALIQYLHEIIDGYATCEKRARDPDIKYIFYEFKLDRINMQRQLTRLMPNESYTLLELEQVDFLLNLDGADHSISDEQLVNEICRGDRKLINKYAETLKTIPSAPKIIDALKDHIQEIQNNIQFITTNKTDVDGSYYH